MYLVDEVIANPEQESLETQGKTGCKQSVGWVVRLSQGPE